MNFKKTTIATVVAATLGTSSATIADTINLNFTGVFTQIGNSGSINTNIDAAGTTDAQGNTYLVGSRTPISGTATFDTASGIGNATINPFSFFAGGLASMNTISLQAIGDGSGGPGSLIAGAMAYDWNGTTNVPATAIFDAAGFFGSIGAPGASWSIDTSACPGCATSATPDTALGATVGLAPMAMTTFNTAGTTLGSLFPLTTDGTVGSPLTTPPISGGSFAFDFTTINATNVTAVPVPAAAWLFGSGLLGLVGVARRRRQS